MKIGLALSGGGARGFAHIGVLKALLEHGFEPEIISGASAGGLVGALYASGHQPEEMMDIFAKAKIRTVFSLSTKLVGFLKMERIEKFLELYLPHNSFEKLAIPLTINATDIQAGKIVYFHEGELIRPLMASCCIPVLFEPVRINGRMMVDGGILNNLPVEPLLGKCGFMVGVHTNPCGTTQPLPNMKAVMERSLLLAIQNNVRERAVQCDFFVEPPDLCGFTTMDAAKAREIFNIGHQYVTGNIGRLHKAYEEKMAGKQPHPQPLSC